MNNGTVDFTHINQLLFYNLSVRAYENSRRLRTFIYKMKLLLATLLTFVFLDYSIKLCSSEPSKAGKFFSNVGTGIKKEFEALPKIVSDAAPYAAQLPIVGSAVGMGTAIGSDMGQALGGSKSKIGQNPGAAGYTPAGYPPAGYPSAGYPTAGYLPAGYPQAGYPSTGGYPPAAGYQPTPPPILPSVGMGYPGRFSTTRRAGYFGAYSGTKEMEHPGGYSASKRTVSLGRLTHFVQSFSENLAASNGRPGYAGHQGHSGHSWQHEHSKQHTWQHEHPLQHSWQHEHPKEHTWQHKHKEYSEHDGHPEHKKNE